MVLSMSTMDNLNKPTLPDYEKRRIIRDAFSAWRDMAEDAMFARYPELLRKQTRLRKEAVIQ